MLAYERDFERTVATVARPKSPAASELAGDQKRKKASPVLYVCRSLQEWLQPGSAQYQGLLVPRSPTWGDFQQLLDRKAAQGIFGREQALLRTVRRGRGGNFDNVGPVIREMLAKAALPSDVSRTIESDACQISTTLAWLCPSAAEVEVKLEVMGESVCSRWHRDNYRGRAIVSYNLAATMFTADSNVNEWELENCGNNDHIIRDTNKVCNLGVGDILFIKGMLFPSGAKGLIHKSADRQFHPGGSVMNRLVLKVDVPDEE